MQTNKVQTNSGFLLFSFLSVSLSLSVLSELINLGTKVCQSGPKQRPGFKFRFCFQFSQGQMRVSWCQRLDGRMLSTFSMMKFRGANSVLRNCRETKRKVVLDEAAQEVTRTEPDPHQKPLSFCALHTPLSASERRIRVKEGGSVWAANPDVHPTSQRKVDTAGIVLSSLVTVRACVYSQLLQTLP